MVVFKNGHGLLGLAGFLKSAVSQEWINGMNWFFACWYKFRKVISCFINSWLRMVKNRQFLIYHGTQNHGPYELGVSHIWFDELRRIIEWFVHGDSDGRNNFWFVLHLNTKGPLVVVLSHIFLRKTPFGQKQQKMIESEPKTRCFHYFEKFCNWFLREMFFNRNWCCYLAYCTNHISGEILVLEL